MEVMLWFCGWMFAVGMSAAMVGKIKWAHIILAFAAWPFAIGHMVVELAGKDKEAQ